MYHIRNTLALRTLVNTVCTQMYTCTFVDIYTVLLYIELTLVDREAKYVESWPNTTSAWADWSRFDIPVNRSDGVHSLIICTS
jgi:hypothetical protein